MVAIQVIDNGQFVNFFPTKESAKDLLASNKHLEAIVIHPNIIKIEVCYCEPSGPNGYGCNTLEFTTYGSVVRRAINLAKFAKSSCRIFGPDYREVKDYLTHCHVYLNDIDKTEWWFKQVDNILKYKPIFL